MTHDATFGDKCLVIRSHTTTKEPRLSGTLVVLVGSHADIRRIYLAWARCVVLVCGADVARALAFKALALLLPPPAKKNAKRHIRLSLNPFPLNPFTKFQTHGAPHGSGRMKVMSKHHPS